MPKRMNSPLSLLLASAMSLASLSASAALPQTGGGDRVANDLRRNVVRIEARENGFGFIVGEASGLLYIVTAHHVVVDPDKVETQGSAKVRVEFFERRGVKFDAVLLGTHDTYRDLAVLTVHTPQGLQWTKECLAGPDKQKRGTSVWFVGRDQEWKPPIEPGHVVVETSTDWVLELEGLPVKPGSSGGPVISETGIIGMIEKDSQDGTNALSIDFIEKSFKEWQHPWQLLLVKSSGSDGESKQTDLEAVNAAVDLYTDSYNRLDAAALWKIWPSPPAQTKKAIEEYFRNARSINRQLTDRNVQLSQATATVTARCLDVFTPRSGGQLHSNDSIVLELEKRTGQWVITSVR